MASSVDLVTYRCLAEVPGLLEELALLEWHFLAQKSGCQMLPNTSVSQ